jgi:hypothetical protein
LGFFSWWWASVTGPITKELWTGLPVRYHIELRLGSDKIMYSSNLWPQRSYWT